MGQPVISHSVDVTGFPGLVLWFHFPLLLESLCSDTLQHNEKQIEFLLRSLSFWYKSPESFSAMKKPGRNRNRHMTEPWEEDGQKKKKVWVSYLCPIVQREYTVSQFVLGYTVRWDVQKSCSFFPRLCLCVCVFFWSTVSLSHASDLSHSSRDFQFGHMDGNDYINSLIMG